MLLAFALHNSYKSCVLLFNAQWTEPQTFLLHAMKSGSIYTELQIKNTTEYITSYITTPPAAIHGRWRLIM
jgi:hypothetical protein